MQKLISPEMGLVIWIALNAALLLFIVAVVIKVLRKNYKLKKEKKKF